MLNLYSFYVKLLYNDIQFQHIKSLYKLYKKDKTILDCFNNFYFSEINNGNIVFTCIFKIYNKGIDKGETFHNYMFLIVW